MTKAPQYPVPEFIKGAKGAGWDIIDSRTAGGGASMRPGILHVPLDMACPICGKAHSHAIRNHEVAHAAVTLDKYGRMPVLPPGLKLEYFQAVEDQRIWEHVHRSNEAVHGSALDEDGEYINPPALCETERVKWEAVYEGLDDKGRVLFASAAGPSDREFIDSIVKAKTPPEATLDADTILKIRNHARELLLEGGYTYNGQTPPIRNTYAAAAWLQSILDPDEDDAKEGSDADPDAGSDPGDEDIADGREERGEGREAREAKPGELKPDRPTKHTPSYGEGTTWAPMTIEEPTLGRHLPGRLIARYQSADEGAFIRRPDRLLTDQKVFGKKKRIQGGGVLIDASGSMGLSHKDIMEILLACPGATIGVYAGDGGSGRLRVIARDGKVVQNEREMTLPGGYNEVDGPALRWLGQLPFTRKVWISDGVVTGTHDHASARLDLERDLLLRKYSITWVNSRIHDDLPQAAVNVLTTGRVMPARKGA